MAARHRIEPLPRARILALAVVFEGGMVALWLLLGKLLGMEPSEHGSPTVEALLQGVFATIPLLPLLLAITRSTAAPLRRLMVEVDEVLVPALSKLSVPDFVLVSLLAGVGEEGVFRGIIQVGIASKTTAATGLAAASILFGLVHAVTPAYAVLAGLLGAYLGGLFLVSGNLIVPMTVHACYDFFALLYLVRWRGRGHPDI